MTLIVALLLLPSDFLTSSLKRLEAELPAELEEAVLQHVGRPLPLSTSAVVEYVVLTVYGQLLLNTL